MVELDENGFNVMVVRHTGKHQDVDPYCNINLKFIVILLFFW